MVTKFCPWCDIEYPIEFFQIHHLNHIHEDDRPENEIEICMKCHMRHHKESGYDTIIIKKNEYKPKTLLEEMASVEREEFLIAYRHSIGNQWKSEMRSIIITNTKKSLKEWIKENGECLCNHQDKSFKYKDKSDTKNDSH